REPRSGGSTRHTCHRAARADASGPRGGVARHTSTPPVVNRRGRGVEELAGADLETHEAGDGRAGLVEDRLDGLLRVRHGRLLEQDDVLEVAVDAAFDDLRQSLLRLALGLGGLLGDTPL